MNDRLILTESLIEAMLARRAGPGAPIGLAASIADAVGTLPAARRPWWSVLVPPVGGSPASRMVWMLAIVGLLLAATVSAIYVGSELLRDRNELTVVPQPTTVVPAPSAAPAPAAAPAIIAASPIEQSSDLAFAPDGSLWLATRAGVLHWDIQSATSTLYGLNEGLPTTEAGHVLVAPDGSVWASGQDWVARFDGTWAVHRVADAWSPITAIAVDADGTLWAAAIAHLLRYDGRWTSLEVAESVAGDASPWAFRLAVAPDGTVWAGVPAAASFDGGTWINWSKQATGLPRAPSLAGIAPDGSVWVELEAEGCAWIDPGYVECETPAAGVARFDGFGWTTYSAANGLVDDDATLLVGSDGTVWATYPAAPTAISRFEEQGWATAQVPDLGPLSERGGARAITVAPDGALWLITADGLLRWDGVTATSHPWPAVDLPATVPPLALEPIGEPTVADSALGTITWQVYRGSFPDILTPYGPVASDGVELRWIGPDGALGGRMLPEEASGIVPVGDGLLAYGQATARMIRWDGSTWVVGDELDVPPSLVGSSNTEVRVAAGPRGVLIAGYEVATSADAQHFVAATQRPGGDNKLAAKIGPVVATSDGFIALVATGQSQFGNDPLFEPVPWFSADGLTWEWAASSSPFGAGSWIWDVAGREGRYVAVGEFRAAWATWVSDDGLTWERLPDFGLGRNRSCSTCPIRVTAGDAGWVISTGRRQSLWASQDGRRWEPLAVPGISIEEAWGILPRVGLGGDTIVVHGSDGVSSAVGTIVP